MGFNDGKNSGSVKVLADKTFTEFNIKFEELNAGSHKKVYVQCKQCSEIFLRERRKLHCLHRCPNHLIREDGVKLKWCSSCKEFLTYKCFSKNSLRADKLCSWCKTCSSQTPSAIKSRQTATDLRKTFDGWIKNYLSAKKSRCKNSGIECDLSVEALKELWATQDGRCYYSHVKMVYGEKSLYAANLDRLDPLGGYKLSNVVWSSSAMNGMKNKYSKDELTTFLHDIIFTNVRFEYQKNHPDAKLPFRKRTTDAGFDLASVEELVIPPREVRNVNTGLRISPPEGWYLSIDGRSSLFQEGIVPFRGIIDSNYTGVLFCSLYNSSDSPFKIEKGDRIAQITVHQTHSADFVEVDEFSPEYSLSRGDKGWGSSGRK